MVGGNVAGNLVDGNVKEPKRGPSYCSYTRYTLTVLFFSRSSFPEPCILIGEFFLLHCIFFGYVII